MVHDHPQQLPSLLLEVLLANHGIIYRRLSDGYFDLTSMFAVVFPHATIETCGAVTTWVTDNQASFPEHFSIVQTLGHFQSAQSCTVIVV